MSRGIIQTAVSQTRLGLELDYRPTFTFRADEILMDEPIRTELTLQDTGHQTSDWRTYFLRAIYST